ncbi:hypothetical protein [Pseudomonas sp. NA-150]
MNTLSSGPTETAMFDSDNDEIRETLTRRIPLQRLGQPDDIKG